MTKRKSTTSDGPENLIARSERGPRLEDIEQAETTLWVEQQMNRIHEFLVERGADSEMLDAVAYLIEENDRWIDPQVAEDLRAGNLRSGVA
jgi:prolyl oligopeptidase PreP (S9A serine peptidase family)